MSTIIFSLLRNIAILLDRIFRPQIGQSAPLHQKVFGKICKLAVDSAELLFDNCVFVQGRGFQRLLARGVSFP
jgi:hypothetical protein